MKRLQILCLVVLFFNSISAVGYKTIAANVSGALIANNNQINVEKIKYGSGFVLGMLLYVDGIKSILKEKFNYNKGKQEGQLQGKAEGKLESLVELQTALKEQCGDLKMSFLDEKIRNLININVPNKNAIINKSENGLNFAKLLLGVILTKYCYDRF